MKTQTLLRTKVRAHIVRAFAVPAFVAHAFIAVLLLTGGIHQSRADVPQVAVTVSPVHSLVAGLMHDVGAPQLLIAPGQSPHSAPLKPSQAKMLQRADLIIWVGEALESRMAKAIDARRAHARVVTMLDEPQIFLLRGLEGEGDGHGDHVADNDEHGEHGEHSDHDKHADEHSDGHDDEHDDDHADGHADDHADEHDHGDGHDGHDDDGHDDHSDSHSKTADADEHHEHDHHDHAVIDPHIWLSVDNARAMVRIIARELIALDSQNRTRYLANQKRLLAKLSSFEKTLRAKIEPIADAPYLVYHDAYRYFEREFNLHSLGAVVLGAHRPPGVKRAREVLRMMRGEGVRCVFREPQFSPKLVQALAAEGDVRIGVLDPLGAQLPPGEGAWFALLDNLAESLRDCLGVHH